MGGTMKNTLTDVDKFEIEVEKLGKVASIDLLVSTVRGARGRRKLFGEAFHRDAFTPVVYFKVLHATDIDDLYMRFIKQLIHRGFVPTRFRKSVSDRFQEWNPVDLSPFDMSDHEAAKVPMDVDEAT